MKRPLDLKIGNTKMKFTYAPTTGRIALKAPGQEAMDKIVPFADIIADAVKAYNPPSTVRGKLSFHNNKLVFQVKTGGKAGAVAENMPLRFEFPLELGAE